MTTKMKLTAVKIKLCLTQLTNPSGMIILTNDLGFVFIMGIQDEDKNLVWISDKSNNDTFWRRNLAIDTNDDNITGIKLRFALHYLVNVFKPTDVRIIL